MEKGKEKKKTGSIAGCMANNLRYCNNQLIGTEEAKFLLSSLKKKLGASQQSIIVDCVRFSFQNNPYYDRVRSEISREWEERQHSLAEIL